MQFGKLVLLFIVTGCLLLVTGLPYQALSFQIPDTGQTARYKDTEEIPCPASSEPFYVQDAQRDGSERPCFKVSHGVISDKLSTCAQFSSVNNLFNDDNYQVIPLLKPSRDINQKQYKPEDVCHA